MFATHAKEHIHDVSCRANNEASKRLIIACDFCETYSENKTDSRTGKPYVLNYYEFARK